MHTSKKGLVFGFDKALTDEEHESLYSILSPSRRIEVEGANRLYDLPDVDRHSDDNSE